MTVPNGEGVWWASFDDGEMVLETVLLDVRCYRGETAFESGAVVTMVDGSGRWFGMRSIDQRIVRPGVTVPTASGPGFSQGDEMRITWLRKVVPPKNAPKRWDTVTEDRGEKIG